LIIINFKFRKLTLQQKLQKIKPKRVDEKNPQFNDEWALSVFYG